MVVDHANLFSKCHDLLIDICQFNVQLSNKLISSNVNFAKDIGLDDVFESSNEMMIQEINEYKVYDC